MRNTNSRFDLWRIQSSDYPADMRKSIPDQEMWPNDLFAPRGGACARLARDVFRAAGKPVTIIGGRHVWRVACLRLAESLHVVAVEAARRPHQHRHEAPQLWLGRELPAASPHRINNLVRAGPAGIANPECHSGTIRLPPAVILKTVVPASERPEPPVTPLTTSI